LAKDMTNNVSEIKKIHEIAEELFCIVPTWINRGKSKYELEFYNNMN
jgi:pyruvate carboxylase